MRSAKNDLQNTRQSQDTTKDQVSSRQNLHVEI